MEGDDTLHDAISRFYTMFAPYPLHRFIAGCPCCVGPTDDARIRSKPLRDLTAEDVGRYSFKALTTWGTVDDYKHFLPRLLELVIDDPSFDEVIVPTKLQWAQWQHWPEQERRVIDSYLLAVWRCILGSDDPAPLRRWPDDWVTFIGRIVDDMTSYLALWQDSTVVSARRHLASFVCDNSIYLLPNKGARTLLDVYWKERPHQMNQVIAWLSEPQRQTQLEQAFFDHATEPWADELAQAADVLRELHAA